jgi:hypothetical protein
MAKIRLLMCLDEKYSIFQMGQTEKGVRVLFK